MSEERKGGKAKGSEGRGSALTGVACQGFQPSRYRSIMHESRTKKRWPFEGEEGSRGGRSLGESSPDLEFAEISLNDDVLLS
jgi:hypothetical protein